MSTQEELRVYENFTGKGKACKGEQFIADVKYSIKEVEELLDTEFYGDKCSEEAAGQRNFCGVIMSSSAELFSDHVGAKLTLHFQDGRLLDFTVSKIMGKNSCLIQGLGGLLERS